MTITNSILIAIVAGGVGTLCRLIAQKLTAPDWLSFWIGVTIALIVFGTGGLVIR